MTESNVTIMHTIYAVNIDLLQVQIVVNQVLSYVCWTSNESASIKPYPHKVSNSDKHK